MTTTHNRRDCAGREDGMGKIFELLAEILKELKIINKQLSELTGKHFVAGKRFDL